MKGEEGDRKTRQELNKTGPARLDGGEMCGTYAILSSDLFTLAFTLPRSHGAGRTWIYSRGAKRAHERMALEAGWRWSWAGVCSIFKILYDFPPSQVASSFQQFSREESRINRGRGNFYIRPAASILDFLKFFFNRISKFLSVSFFFSKLGKLCIKKGEGRGRGN